jgi:hypothetical protein
MLLDTLDMKCYNTLRADCFSFKMNPSRESSDNCIGIQSKADLKRKTHFLFSNHSHLLGWLKIEEDSKEKPSASGERVFLQINFMPQLYFFSVLGAAFGA